MMSKPSSYQKSASKTGHPEARRHRWRLTCLKAVTDRSWSLLGTKMRRQAATTSLQRLPVSSACHSPAPTILQRLPFSSACHSPATLFPATFFLQPLPFMLIHNHEETRFHYLRRCEGSGQRAYQYLAERRMDEEERNGSYLP